MTTGDFDKSETEVKLFYKASITFKVKADTREEAHKVAYNTFMDSSPQKILSSSGVEYDFIETTIDGDEGSDMLHGP